MMDITLLIGSLTSMVGLACTLVISVRKFGKETHDLVAALRRHKTIIGVFSSVPQCLIPYADFSSDKKGWRRALLSDGKIVVIHCKSLSWALSHTDWVAYDGKDPKMRSVDDDAFWKSVVGDVHD